MKGLLLRDIRAYIGFFITLLIVMVLYSLLIYKVGSPNGLVGFLVVFIPPIAGVVLFLGDNELLMYMAALPVSRRQLVLTKYISTYIWGAFLVVVTVLITWYLGRTFEYSRIDFANLITLRGILFAILPITVIVSVSYPFLFRFGLSLGTKILMGGFALLYGIGSMIGERLVQNRLNVTRGGIFANAMALFAHGEESMGVVAFYAAMITFILLLVSGSVVLSVFWIRKKDFN